MTTKKTTATSKPKKAPTNKSGAKKTEAKKTTTKKKTAKKTTSKPKKVEKVPVLSKAEQLCAGVNPQLKAQAVTLANAVLTMQEKIEQQIPIYKDEPLAQQVTLGSGEQTLRANPMVQEFRATVRDYATALDNLEEILESKAGASGPSPVEALRNRFRVG